MSTPSDLVEIVGARLPVRGVVGLGAVVEVAHVVDRHQLTVEGGGVGGFATSASQSRSFAAESPTTRPRSPATRR